jgi:hypothetical protein
MRSAWGVGHGNAGGKACATAEPLFPAMQMIATGQVDPKTIGRRHRRDRRPAPDRQ